VVDGKSYTDLLPSLNLGFDLGSDQMLRLGVAKVLARPQMDKMKASSSFSLSTGQNGADPILTGAGGNPHLDPFRAKAFDLSYEKYFGKKGVISVAYFYKKLDSYILDVGRQFDFKPFVTASTPLPSSGTHAGSTVGILTTPTNGSGGNIHGVELNMDVPFSLATSWLDGFGVQVNHSDTKSSVSLPTSGFTFADTPAINIPMPGLSRRVTNTKLYYEANGFQIGLAQKKRSDFLGEISDYEDTRKLTFIKGESIVDLQVAYEFQNGPLRGLTLNVSAQNLSNAKFQRYVNDPSKPVEVVSYGKTYLFGANYKF
jgi:iron complex outermembrane recepter protein